MSVGEIYNYREAAPDLATSGQPREDQLAAIAEAGYDVVINLALHDDPRYSLKDEASSVRRLGLEYIHIPVQFAAPTESDLVKFFDAMDGHRHHRVWVHCAANMRVTAFVGLYRRLREGWPEERAFALIREIWQPDEVWSQFIASQLGKSNESPDEMQTYYAARAPEYDSVYLKPEQQPDLRAIESWIPAIFANSKVLEIACGTGHWTQFIAQSAANVVAIDASREMLRIAETRIHSDKVALYVADAYSLPPHIGSFGAAFAGFWFSHVPKARRQAFLRGLSPFLIPGAKVVLLDNLYVEGSSSPITETDSDGNTYQARKLKDGSTHRVLKNFPSEAELQSSIAGVGRGGTLSTWRYFWAFQFTANEP